MQRLQHFVAGLLFRKVGLLLRKRGLAELSVSLCVGRTCCAVVTSAFQSSFGRNPRRKTSLYSASISSSCTLRSCNGKLFDEEPHPLA